MSQKNGRFKLHNYVEKAIRLLGGERPGVAVSRKRIVGHVHIQLAKKYPLAQIKVSVEATLKDLLNDGIVIKKGENLFALRYQPDPTYHADHAGPSIRMQRYAPINHLETKTTKRMHCVSSTLLHPTVTYTYHSECSLSGSEGERALEIMRPTKGLRSFTKKLDLPGAEIFGQAISSDALPCPFIEPGNLYKLVDANDSPETPYDNYDNISHNARHKKADIGEEEIYKNRRSSKDTSVQTQPSQADFCNHRCRPTKTNAKSFIFKKDII